MTRAREVAVKLGGEERRMRWDMNAIATVEELTGGNALEGVEITARNLRALVYAALAAADEAQDRDPALSLRQVGSLLDEDSLPGVIDAVGVLVNGNSPEVVGANPPLEGAGEKPSPSPTPTASVASISDSVSPSSGD